MNLIKNTSPDMALFLNSGVSSLDKTPPNQNPPDTLGADSDQARKFLDDLEDDLNGLLKSNPKDKGVKKLLKDVGQLKDEFSDFQSSLKDGKMTSKDSIAKFLQFAESVLSLNSKVEKKADQVAQKYAPEGVNPNGEGVSPTGEGEGPSPGPQYGGGLDTLYCAPYAYAMKSLEALRALMLEVQRMFAQYSAQVAQILGGSVDSNGKLVDGVGQMQAHSTVDAGEHEAWATRFNAIGQAVSAGVGAGSAIAGGFSARNARVKSREPTILLKDNAALTDKLNGVSTQAAAGVKQVGGNNAAPVGNQPGQNGANRVGPNAPAGNGQPEEIELDDLGARRNAAQQGANQQAQQNQQAANANNAAQQANAAGDPDPNDPARVELKKMVSDRDALKGYKYQAVDDNGFMFDKKKEEAVDADVTDVKDQAIDLLKTEAQTPGNTKAQDDLTQMRKNVAKNKREAQSKISEIQQDHQANLQWSRLIQETLSSGGQAATGFKAADEQQEKAESDAAAAGYGNAMSGLKDVQSQAQQTASEEVKKTNDVVGLLNALANTANRA